MMEGGSVLREVSDGKSGCMIRRMRIRTGSKPVRRHRPGERDTRPALTEASRFAATRARPL